MDLLLFPVMLFALIAPAALFRRRHQLPEALALGALVSLGLWSVIAFARFLLLLPPSSSRTVGLFATALTLAGGLAIASVCLRHPRQAVWLAEGSPRQVLVLICGAVLLAIGVEATLPHFGIANLYYDWWEHFDLARFYSNGGDLFRHYQDGYTVTSRTPVFNLLTGLGMTAFGDRFSVFQVATAALGWLWVLPAILLARRFLRDQGLLVVALLTFSPLLLFATTYGWPKGLVAFFALLSLDRFLVLRQKKEMQGGAEAAQFGLAAGLTLMTHEGFAGYLVPLFALLLFDCLRRRARYPTLLIACSAGALAALPWYAWAASQYGLRGGLIGYPEPGYASPILWFADHLTIVVSSALPVTALFHAYGDSWLQQLLVAYLRTAVGLLGVAFLFRMLARLLKPGRQTPEGVRPVLAFALAGILSTTLLLNGWGNGWASAESVFIPAMIALLLVACARAPLTPGMIAFAAVECLTVLAAALVYTWSPASSGEPNARLAVMTQIHFLGQQSWPVGIGLLMAGVAAGGYSLSRPLREHKKEPRAEWREAPLVS